MEMHQTISNRRRLTMSALLIGAFMVLMSAVGLEDAQAAAKVTLCHEPGQQTQRSYTGIKINPGHPGRTHCNCDCRDQLRHPYEQSF